MIKDQIPDKLLADWFAKSFLPPIAQDVAMGGMFTEEQAIIRAQYLDLVYSQLGTLYDLIPNAPRPTNDPSRPAPEPHSDGTIGSVSTPSSSTTTVKKKSSTPPRATLSNVSNAKSDPPPSQYSEVNSVESSQEKYQQQRKGQKIFYWSSSNKNSRTCCCPIETKEKGKVFMHDLCQRSLYQRLSSQG